MVARRAREGPVERPAPFLGSPFEIVLKKIPLLTDAVLSKLQNVLGESLSRRRLSQNIRQQ
jgi:hypothetical protein